MYSQRTSLGVHLLTGIAFRLMLPSLTVFIAALWITHGQGGTETLPLGGLLLPPTGCAAPCLLGIRPGQTTLVSALDHLRANPLIQSIEPVASMPDSPAPSGLFAVQFVLTAPIRTAQMQFVTEPRTGVINRILFINSGLPLSDVTLTLGQPAALFLDNRFNTSVVTYAAFYPQNQMDVQVVLPLCTPEVARLPSIRQNVVISIDTISTYFEQRGLYPAATLVNDTGWLQQLHDLKQAECA